MSTGLPKVVIVDVRGLDQTDAVAKLTKLGLQVKVREVPSPKPAGQVLAQDPPPDTKVETRTVVHINVSKGPTPVAVPGVVSQPIDQAASTLQGLGFRVVTTFVESDQPPNTVIKQSPEGGSSAGKGSVVTLTISKGPTTSTVPDVGSLDVASAQSTLADSGFKSKVVYEDVADPSLEGTVLGQTPEADTQAKAGTVVTLTVGRTADTTTSSTTTTTTTP